MSRNRFRAFQLLQDRRERRRIQRQNSLSSAVTTADPEQPSGEYQFFVEVAPHKKLLENYFYMGPNYYKSIV
jgi:hypothetical protein